MSTDVPQGYFKHCCPKVIRTLDYLRTKVYPKSDENFKKIMDYFLTNPENYQPKNLNFMEDFYEIIKNMYPDKEEFQQAFALGEIFSYLLKDGPENIEHYLLEDFITSHMCETEMPHTCKGVNEHTILR